MEAMKIPTSIKLDPRMKKALAKLAEEQMIPVTSVIKQAIDKHLKEHSIDWREEKLKK
jgi:predicted transcriptional regulator